MLDVCLLGTGGMMPLPYRWLTSQINKSESLAFFAMISVGRVSVQYVSLMPFLGGPNTISGR